MTRACRSRYEFVLLFFEESVREIERGTFALLVSTTSGGVPPAAAVVYKRLASLIAEKKKQPYHLTIRCKLSFSLVDSAIMCIRGAQSSPRRPAVSFDSPVLIGGGGGGY